MTRTQLKKWLIKHQKDAVDIAYAGNLNEFTVKRFLAGREIRDNTKKAIRMAIEFLESNPGIRLSIK